ncbi:tRNA (adenosine(37)-N6)-threonylcarbamoyltransferase complex dimerization subunit type 1 TsaB [Paenibacillus sp. NPDC056579]|uniref:tRNA (adenosine(37)-N6)-threonylcarbamoyltransferase complex dimerization subunit type 1 TsaB n=1 Tax=Paenibacillus sp. NPDC056579 TaxID=3345871 RepID=UPI003685136C
MNSDNNKFTGSLLAVDTSTSSMSIALANGKVLVDELTSKAERNHSIHLIPHIQQLLASAGLRPKELDAFAVGVGPGSYTGVRIGVTVGKTFAWTHGMSLIGVSSLEAMALGGMEAFYVSKKGQADHEDNGLPFKELSALDRVYQTDGTSWVVPMIEARRGQAFTALYQVADHRWSCLEKDGIRLMSSWAEALLERGRTASQLPDRIVFTGETELHAEVLQRFFEEWGGEAAEWPHEIKARHIAELGRLQWEAGRTDTAHGLVPNYTQLPEAEAKLLGKKS